MKTADISMGWVLALALVGTAWAQQEKIETNQPLQLEACLVDGSRIIGTPEIKSIPVRTSYAKMDIPLNQILAIHSGNEPETASIKLRNGDQLTGGIPLAPIALTTIFGRITIDRANVRQLTILVDGNEAGTKQGLIAWYKLDDGTAKDSSEFANHGILHDVTTGPDRFQRADRAMLFNGRTSWIEAPSSRVYAALDEITIALWLCPADAPTGTSRSYALVTKQPSGGLSRQHTPSTSNHGGLFDFNLNRNDDVWQLGFCSQVAPHMCTEGHAFPLAGSRGDKWQHMAVTVSRAQNRVCCYLNGRGVGNLVYTEQRATGPILSQPNDEPLRIGKRKDADFSTDGRLWFTGSMADVRIYNRVLSEDEIRGIAGPRP